MKRVAIFLITAALLTAQQPFAHVPSTLSVTALSATNAAVTATLPAVTGQFHYITSILIVRYCTTAIVGSAALVYTTTNLPGSLAWSTGNACTVGTTYTDVSLNLSSPLQSSASATATTIVAPAAGTAGFVRINVFYFTGPAL